MGRTTRSGDGDVSAEDRFTKQREREAHAYGVRLGLSDADATEFAACAIRMSTAGLGSLDACCRSLGAVLAADWLSPEQDTGT